MKAEDLTKLLGAVPAKSLEKFIEIKKELDKVDATRAGLLSQMDNLLGGIGEEAAPAPVRRRGRPRKTAAAPAKVAKAKPAAAKAVKAAKPKKAAAVKKAAAKKEAAPKAVVAGDKPKRGRGRPPKQAAAEAAPAPKEKKTRGRKPGSGPRPGSAVAYAVEVLKASNKPMTIAEIVDAIAGLGFVSKAKNPTTSIAQQLYKSPYIVSKTGKFSIPT